MNGDRAYREIYQYHPADGCLLLSSFLSLILD